jgi:hypothetical protein
MGSLLNEDAMRNKDMKPNINTLTIILLAGLILLSFAAPLFARTVWVSGTVTKSPWLEKYSYIEVDGVKYTFMPKDVNMERQYQAYDGIWHRESILLRDIREGHRVMMRVQGHRIYQLFLEGW